MPTFCMKFLLVFSFRVKKCLCCDFFFLQVTFYHLLKLFQTESALASGKKQLVSEFYDEVVSRTYVFGYVFLFQLVECLNPCISLDFPGPHTDDASMFTQCKTVTTIKHESDCKNFF